MSIRKVILAVAMATGLWATVAGAAENVIEDDGVGMSQQELEILVQYWTPEMQEAAANDLGDRFELLSMSLANKKIAEEAKKLTPEEDPQRYWKNQFVLRNIERKSVVDHYMENLPIPDMSKLAQEMYLTNKDEYALVPEARKSSHILVKCMPVDCERETQQALADQVLAELLAGADFAAMAAKYSDDPGSKDAGGVFDRWLQLGMQGVDRSYVDGVFSIEGVGEYSGIVESPFGFHIIRLDDVRETFYRSFEDARDDIINTLEVEYKTLAAKEFDAQYRLSDDANIDGEAMEQIFSKYKSVEAPAQ
jgi:peptidyl-prolyl cis-trans isomerase D